MKVFLTGGAGYIGSAMAEALLKAGHEVTVYDSLVAGHQAATPEGARFIQANLNDSAALAEALAEKPYEAVMHFAAFIDAGASMKNPGKYFRNNVTNSQQLIELAVNSGVRRFVLSSTAAVYASSDKPLTENMPLEPNNVYGYTKVVTEQMLAWYQQIHGLHFAALRYFNAAGALPARGEAHHPETHLIPRTLQVALGQREAIHVYGINYATLDGTAIRDYVHIGDVVSAHELALYALETQPRLIYNVGNGVGYSVREVIETARKVTGHPIPMVETARRPGDAARLVASAKRIRNELGWHPKMPALEAIIASAWKWHCANPYGYET